MIDRRVFLCRLGCMLGLVQMRVSLSPSLTDSTPPQMFSRLWSGHQVPMRIYWSGTSVWHTVAGEIVQPPPTFPVAPPIPSFEQIESASEGRTKWPEYDALECRRVEYSTAHYPHGRREMILPPPPVPYNEWCGHESEQSRPCGPLNIPRDYRQ